MASTPGQARVWVWAAAVLSGSVVVTLSIVAVIVGLDTADGLASIAGAALGALGLVVTAVQLARPGNDTTLTGARSVQSGGSVGRAVTGDNNRLQGSTTVVPPSGLPPSPSYSTAPPGERSVTAAEGIGEAITGDGNDAT
jgi:hypothetical protein